MSNTVNKSIGSFVDEALTLFGDDVNSKRQLPLIWDGLKPSYRRLINEALHQGDQMKKVAAIVGTCIATTHPHGSASLEKPVSNLVRWGIFEGQGNHGAKTIVGDDIEPAAPRYIEAKIAPQYREFFSDLMPYVPYVEAEMEGNVEPVYLPTPYPICLTHGTLGIGLGVNTRIPAFTMKSIHEAFMSNDPWKLKAPFGLEIDYSNSDLDAIWETGLGRITYKFKTEELSIDAGKGIMVSGSPELWKPLFVEVNKQVNAGRLFIIDMSDESGDRIFIGKSNYVRISMEELHELVNYETTYQKVFRLTVADCYVNKGEDPNRVFLIPLKEWLSVTYNNYLNIVELYKSDKIKKLQFEYRVYKWLPEVTRILLEHRDWNNEDIYNTIDNDDCDLEVIQAILRKSINTLRNTDSSNKLEAIANQIKQYEKLDARKRVQDVINKF